MKKGREKGWLLAPKKIINQCNPPVLQIIMMIITK
jgi:hypothetical protein